MLVLLRVFRILSAELVGPATGLAGVGMAVAGADVGPVIAGAGEEAGPGITGAGVGARPR